MKSKTYEKITRRL